MILTEEKTYIINVTEVDTDAELGLNKKDIMIEYTNLELLHGVSVRQLFCSPLSHRLRDASSPKGASLWQAGPLPTGRLRPDMAQKGGPCFRG